MASTQEEIIDLVRETRTDWAATPQSVTGPESGVIKTQGDSKPTGSESGNSSG